MVIAPTQERFAPDAPFRFVGGDHSLDFINTADWTPRGLERDRFTEYNRLVEWGRGAGLLSVAEARSLEQTAAAHPRRAAASLQSALAVREVLRDIFSSTLTGRQNAGALERFNALLVDATAKLCLQRGEGGRLVRGWPRIGESLDSLLWPVVWAAADLLVASDVDRLRMCEGQDCGWMYVDRSRNGLRRWCEMNVCGTAEKNRRRALR